MAADVFVYMAALDETFREAHRVLKREGLFAFTVQATDAHAQTGSRAYALQIDLATLSLSPASVANGVLGSAYGQVFTASGGVAPYAYQIASGALPASMVARRSTSSSSASAGTMAVR